MWVHATKTGKNVSQFATAKVLVGTKANHTCQVGPAQMFDGLVMRLEDALCVQQQVSSVRGRLHFLGTLHELVTDAFFEPLDLPTDRALCHPKCHRSIGECSGLDDGRQRTEGFDVELHLHLDSSGRDPRNPTWSLRELRSRSVIPSS